MSKLFGDDYEGRKAVPVFEGVLMYFPKAIAAVAEVSEAGNKQHNPGQPLHWARGKSMDQFNTALRHMMDHRMGGGRIKETEPTGEAVFTNNGWVIQHRDTDGSRHLAKAAWRILAALELAIEAEEEELKKAPTQDVSASSYKRCTCGEFMFNANHPTGEVEYAGTKHRVGGPCYYV
jgi:Domain of unknown function (DUF5664)